MANRAAAPVALAPGDLLRLRAAAAGEGAMAPERARIVLLAAAGRSNSDIAAELGVSRPTVIGWRRRYAEHGLPGLRDAPRHGRTPRLDHRQIVTAMLEAPPRQHKTTQWSARLLAAHLGVSSSTIARAWQSYGVRPRGAGTFRFATTPELVAYVTDVVGLGLTPRGSIAVLRVHDASGPALSRHAGRHTELASGLAPIAAYAALRAALAAPQAHDRTPGSDLATFLDRARDAHPAYDRGQPDLVLVVHGAGRPHPALDAWLTANPRARMHRCSDRDRWLNLLEAFLTLVELPATRRGAVGCVPELDELVRQVVEDRSRLGAPFIWTAGT